MNKLKELREERGLTVRKLEELIGIKFATLNHYETELRDLNTKVINTLANFYEVTTDYLLGLDDSFLYVSYEKTKSLYIVRESLYKYFFQKDLIYFKDNKRYIDLNKFFDAEKMYDISSIIDYIYYSYNVSVVFDDDTASNEEMDRILHPVAIEINAFLLSKIYEILKSN